MSAEKTNKPSMRERMWGEIRNESTDIAFDDDIQQYDNPIPGWWKAICIATIAFAFPYIAYFHGGGEGRTAAELHSVALAANARLQFADIGELTADEPTLVKYANNKNWVAVGKSIFQTNCGACHGRDGGGKIGPNLCDENYKNVADITDIYKVISNGAAAGAMPPWKAKLQQNELVLVSSYVASLRGSSPATPKAAEGREIPAWPEYVPEPVEANTADNSEDSDQ